MPEFSISLVPRQHVPLWLSGLTLATSVTLGLVLGTLALLAFGVTLRAIVDEFILYSFTNARGLAQTLTKATPLLMVGLASAAVLKLRFWNIGVDGQIWLGAIGATAIAVHDIGPPEIRLTLMALAAFLAGAAWISLPLLLRLRLGVNEVITTLMLSYIAFLLVQHLLYGPWRDPGSRFPVSMSFEPGVERLGRIGFGHVSTGLWLSLGATVVLSWLLLLSRTGFYVTAIGLNPSSGRAAGLPRAAVITGIVLLAGGLFGLAGFIIVAGQEYRLTQHLGHGYTFSAILIAFLARFNPLAVVPTALAVAGLYTAGDTLRTLYQLPMAAILVVQAIILFCVVCVDFLARYRLGWRRPSATNSPASTEHGYPL